MRYLAIFLFALSVTIATWCISIGSLGWIASLVGIGAAVYIFVSDMKFRADMARIDADHERRMAEIRRRFS